MALSILLLLALLTGLLLLLPKCHPKARGHLPPGPQPLPFFGNFLHMGRRGLLKFFLEVSCKWRGSEGGSQSLYLGVTHQKEKVTLPGSGMGCVKVGTVKGMAMKHGGWWPDSQRRPTCLSVHGCYLGRGQVGTRRYRGASPWFRISHLVPPYIKYLGACLLLEGKEKGAV